MRAALYEHLLISSATDSLVGGGASSSTTLPVAQTPSAQPDPHRGAPTWQSQLFAPCPEERANKRRATRYERFTTTMVLVSSVLVLVVTASLYGFNYGLETKTSSTSGTHGGFYKEQDEK